MISRVLDCTGSCHWPCVRVSSGQAESHRHLPRANSAAFLILCLLAARPSAAECLDYGAFAHWADGINTPGHPYAVTISGTRAYVADLESGMQVIDISNPQSLQSLGAVALPGRALSVVVSGVYAYLADGHAGLQVVDVSDPAHPQIVGGVDTPGYAWG